MLGFGIWDLGVDVFEPRSASNFSRSAARWLAAASRATRMRKNDRQMDDSQDGKLDGGAAQRRGEIVDRHRYREQPAKQRIRTTAREPSSKLHRDVLPAALGLVVDLHVAADALDVGIEREDPLEAGGEDHQRYQGAEGDGDHRRGRDHDGGPGDEDDRDQDQPGRAALPDGRAHGGVFRLPQRIGIHTQKLIQLTVGWQTKSRLNT